jgi:regulator of RNase E activity RraA
MTDADRDDLAQRLSRCYAAAVHDVLRAMGHAHCTLPHDVLPLDTSHAVAGEVWTVSGRFDATLDAHTTLLEWTGLLSRAPAGRVIVCQPHTHDVALMGELSAETLHRKGVRGYIVDGGCRDTAFITRLGFPVFCRFVTPKDIVGRWVPEGFGEPVTIEGVEIATGDWVIGDRDGVLVIPGAIAAEVVEKTEVAIGTESAVRKAILEGVDPREAYLRFGKF